MQNAVSASKPQANLEDYNPFDGQKQTTNTTNNVAASDNNGPAVMNPSSEPPKAAAAPPEYTPSGQQQISTADFQVCFSVTNPLIGDRTCVNFLILISLRYQELKVWISSSFEFPRNSA